MHENDLGISVLGVAGHLISSKNSEHPKDCEDRIGYGCLSQFSACAPDSTCIDWFRVE